MGWRLLHVKRRKDGTKRKTGAKGNAVILA
jgi:hypothetical protein